MYEDKINRLNEVIKEINTKLEMKNDEDKLSEEELLRLQNRIITEFEEDIITIGQALKEKKRYIGESKVSEYIENLERIRTKLKAYADNLKMEEKKMEDAQNKNSNIIINNTNTNTNKNDNANANSNVELKVIFNQVRKEIEENEYLSEEETKEVLEKINEIENINNLDENKKSKWSKLKPSLEWVGTKGIPTATGILSLITAILKAQ